MQALETSGRSARSVARDAGVPYDRVKNLVQGKSQSTSVETARKLAHAFGKTLEAFEAQTDTAVETQPHGLADQARPFIPRSRSEAETLAGVLAPDSTHTTLWRVRTSAAWLGILSGDVLVIDMKRVATSGEVVLANVEDPTTGEAQTRIGTLTGGRLLSGEPGEGGVPILRVRVQGPVVAVVRSAAFARD
jgi:plasmid maintenance system antidote protein VapI